MKLAGKELKLVSIIRQTLEDATMACQCDNCGTLIVNIATVTDGENKYQIGLDCKATLFGEDKDKTAKRKRRDAELFLKACFNKRYKISYDMGDIEVRDMEQPNTLNMPGKIIFLENARYLIGCGIEQTFIQKALNFKP